jgi:ParB-like chromosome segregation protein Spo0J
MNLFENIENEKNLIITNKIIELLNNLQQENIDNFVNCLNNIKLKIHEISPFKNEPVDCVLWIKNENVHANDYNPNSVAPPEMELLALSINSDGYTQPIVTMEHNNLYEVVDGFHRNKVGKENELVRKRILGYLPIVKIKSDRTDKTDRMAATVRHNRARGKHKVESMSDMVIYLKRKNWNDQKIAKELGMEADEVLRLAQITGLTDAFKDVDFSNAWEITGL